MGAPRFPAGSAGAILAFACIISAAGTNAQPSPKPVAAADQNAAIVLPLTEIGRVRARTPYCAALARARPGIDAAIAYEYALPVLAQDLGHFRLDSYLTKAKSLTKSERDLSALWDLAIAGRTEVIALREAANEPNVDEAKRREMLDFANALDGAKGRQMMLARQISRIVGTLAEAPVLLAANNEHDQDQRSAELGRGSALPGPLGMNDVASQAYGSALSDTIADRDRTQRLFATFAAEEFIRADLKNAAQHATNAMQLGNCDQT
jgi:hypothetical protein